MIKMTINRFLKRIPVYVIPVILVYIVIGFLVHVYDLHEFTEDEKRMKILVFFQTAFPILLTWWTSVFSKNVIHDDGNELYRTYLTGYSNVVSHLVLQICFLPALMIGYALINWTIVPINPGMILYVVIEGFCLSSVAFMINYSLSNVGVGMFLVGLYAFLVNYIDTLGLLKKISIYTKEDVFVCKTAVWMLVIGGGALILGALKYSLKPNYN